MRSSFLNTEKLIEHGTEAPPVPDTVIRTW
jgi:hypothetical protein